MSLLRTWNEKNLTSEYFQVLRPNFKESYERCLVDYGDDNYLTFYSIAHGVRSWTRRQFNDLVAEYISKLDKSFSDTRLILTRSANSVELLAVIVAGILTGKRICPMNPQYSLAKCQDVIDQIGLSAVVFENATLSSKIEGKNVLNNTDDIIYILTSGTTGRSKIVRQTSTSVMANVEAVAQVHKLQRGRRVLTPLPVFHVNALEFSFFGTLLSGAELILTDSVFPEILFKAWAETNPQILSLVPTVLHSMVEWAEVKRIKIPSVEYIVTAAAALPKALFIKVLENWKIRTLQGFGMSEAVNFSTVMPPDLSAKDITYWATQFDRASIGTCVPGNSVHILKDDGSFAQEGEVGELAIRGFNVMSGYVGKTDASIFVNDTFPTGDLGYYKKDSSGRAFFFITGRKKEIIKKNGFNIPLVEIDDLVAKYLESGEQAIAVGFKSQTSGEELAILFSKNTTKLRMDTVRLQVIKELPEFQWPAVYASCTSDLRSASGKALRSMYGDVLSSETSVFWPKAGIVLDQPISALPL